MILSDIRFNDIADGAALAQQAGTTFNPLADRCIARVTSGGNLRGGVVYSGYTGEGGSIGMHVASCDPKWINRDMLWVAFDYPFNQLRVKKIFAQVPMSNTGSLAFALSFGFREEAVIHDVFPDGDMTLIAMYRERCRFLNIAPRKLCRGASDGR